jgi:hypothetical protein
VFVETNGGAIAIEKTEVDRQRNDDYAAGDRDCF